MISGAGSLGFVSSLSLEKLVLDHEICGTALRLQRGIDCSSEALAVNLINQLGPGGVYLETDHTFKWFKKEPFIPSPVVDRRDRDTWNMEGKKDVFQRSRERVGELKNTYNPAPLGKAKKEKLDYTVRGIMKELGITDLPQGP